MPSLRLGPNAIRKTLSGGGESFGIPRSWGTSSYGSGWPIAPVSPPRDVEFPRSVDFPISINSTIIPRTGWGLMSFAALKEAYENVTEVKIPVNLIWRELTTFVPRIVDSEGNEIPDHPYMWLTEYPDGLTPFNVWITRLIKSLKIYDAPAIFLKRNSSGLIEGLQYVDGSTLFLIVDEFGNQPAPENIQDYVNRMKSQPQSQQPPASTPLPSPSSLIGGTPTSLTEFASKLLKMISEGKSIPDKIPAYTQIIKGTPFSWWSADQIWYTPQSRRMDSPYGESFIEQAWAWIMMIVNISAFELGHYKTGTMPEGFVTLPPGLFPNLDKINAFEQMFNQRMSANSPVERSRLRMFPDGSKWLPTKKPDFPVQLYAQAWKNILHTIGIPPSEFGDIPGQGLGGKGFKEGAVSDLSRNTLNPHREFLNSIFNFVLEKDGVDDAYFDLAFPMEEIDPDKQRTAMYEGMAHGTLSLNDALGQLGLDPVPGSMTEEDEPKPIYDHIANKHLIVAGNTIYVIEDMQVSETGMAIPTLSPQQANQAGADPIGPETVVQQDGKEHTPEDQKTLEAAIQNIRERGTLDNKMISVPSTVKPSNVSKGTATLDVQALMDTDADLEQFQIGIAEEQREHPQLSVAMIRQLVHDHLREDPNYYRERDHRGTAPENRTPDESNRLDKHCGVCPEDDDYFGAPISREIQFSFPDDGHANDVEVVAMTPDGLPPKPALWKPEGGEMDILQSRVGGPQYVREEAAYLLDRSLGFYLVPVAYVAEADGETGAAIYYTMGSGWPHSTITEYAPEWVEKAAVLDYIMSQTDRGYKHNYLTMGDDDTRPILIDNGLGFPSDPDVYCDSPFCEAMLNKPLSNEVLVSIKGCLNDTATWRDIARLVGPAATVKARACAQRLLNERMITPERWNYVDSGDGQYIARVKNKEIES